MCDLALYKSSGKKSCFTQHYQPFNCATKWQLHWFLCSMFLLYPSTPGTLLLTSFKPALFFYVFLQKCYFTLWWIHRRETWGFSPMYHATACPRIFGMLTEAPTLRLTEDLLSLPLDPWERLQTTTRNTGLTCCMQMLLMHTVPVHLTWSSHYLTQFFKLL